MSSASLGAVLTFSVSWALSRTPLKGEPSIFSLELPPYRPANPKRKGRWAIFPVGLYPIADLSLRTQTESGIRADRQRVAIREDKRTERGFMLSKAKTLHGYKLDSLDGEIGKVEEFYFDDRHWAIRYLVADTGNWLSGRRVLISPYALNRVINDEKHLSVDLTKKQIQDSPSWDSHKPVSRQFEDDYYGYYGWPAYWSGSSVWGDYPFIERDRNKWGQSTKGTEAWDRHLHSTRELTGCHLHALDGEIGHIEDFVIDDETWAIRYLIVGTRNWWPGKKVLISQTWIERVSWNESQVFVNHSRQTVKESPEYSEEALLSRGYEIELHRHYNRKGYWIDELAAA